MTEKFCPRCFERFGEEPVRCPKCDVRLVAALDGDLTGKVVDERYEIIETLGKGGMGVVYRARQKIIDRPVALKVLRRELVQDEASVRRFMVEAKAVSALRSPHTITLYDFGITQEGLLYFTMELLDGRPLTDVIRAEAPVAPERAVQIVLQVADSLREAHGKGILHRDLKPDNVFITTDGGAEVAKVLDFGIAKMLDDGTSESITKTGMICGTPMYLSPEQAVGKPLDARSDLYSLAIILYEMLAGQPPFVDATPVAILMKHVSEAPVPVSERTANVRVSRRLERVLMKALAKEPGGRPESIEAFQLELTAALGEKDDDTVPLESMVATATGVQMPEREAFAGEPADGLAEAATGVVEMPVTEDSLAPEKKGGRSRWPLFAAAVAASVVAVVLFFVFFPRGGGEQAVPEEGTRAPVVEEAQGKRTEAPAQPAGVASDAAAAQQESAARAAELTAREAELRAREKALQEASKQAAEVAAAEARRVAQEEAARQAAAEEAKRQAAAEEEAKRQAAAEEEAKRQAAAEEEAKRQAAAEEAKRQAAAAAKRKAAEEAKRKAAEEQRRKEREKKEGGKKPPDDKDDDGLDFEKI